MGVVRRGVMLTDEEFTLIIEALFDIRTELRAIRAILEEDDEQEGSEEEEP
jgi:hypothetical protein